MLGVSFNTPLSPSPSPPPPPPSPSPQWIVLQWIGLLMICRSSRYALPRSARTNTIPGASGRGRDVKACALCCSYRSCQPPSTPPPHLTSPQQAFQFVGVVLNTVAQHRHNHRTWIPLHVRHPGVIPLYIRHPGVIPLRVRSFVSPPGCTSRTTRVIRFMTMLSIKKLSTSGKERRVRCVSVYGHPPGVCAQV